jgi:hypothetical protein
MTARDVGEYVGEFTPTHSKPTTPCQCGDRVVYELPGTPWLCRTGLPPGNAGWRTCQCRHVSPCVVPQRVRSAIWRWYVVPERRS